MNAPVFAHRPCTGCDRVTVWAWRTLLDATRARHLKALRDAIAAGVPLDELKEDAAAFERATAQLLDRAGA